MSNVEPVFNAAEGAPLDKHPALRAGIEPDCTESSSLDGVQGGPMVG